MQATKPKLLFWLNGFFLHFSLAYYLQSKLNADFFGVIDINSKPKKFFQEQTLVNFKKIWFYHDHIKKIQEKPDLDYLSNFEKKYKVDLWRLALNERFFYLHNRFYKFKKQEILSILEQEIKLFESIITDTKPDYFLTYDPVLHHQKLLLELCRANGIKILSIIISSGIDNRTPIVEDGATLDLGSKLIVSDSVNEKITDIQSIQYDKIFQKYLTKRNPSFFDKFVALKEYLVGYDPQLVKSNFMYYGRTRFKVVKDAIFLELKRSCNARYLWKNSEISPDLSVPYVYFPMAIEEEMNLLHYAPYYTNQIEVIRHIAKSIPINYLLYVKEHPAAGLRGWHSIAYYRQIKDIPNVVLVHHKADNNSLIQNSKLLVTIRGHSPLKALKYGKPAIVFGEHPARIIPSVFTVESLNSLPELIRKALSQIVNPSHYDNYVELLNDKLVDFNMFEFENRRDKAFYSGGILSNVPISDKDMMGFLEKNESMFTDMLNAHLKIINDNTKPLK